MKLHPLAGQSAPPSMLINIARLITAYYTERPDPSIPSQRVTFGTSGHRGSAFERAFNEYTVPEAILRFRQGFGRLIRSRSDRGAVVVLDSRILTKSYGKLFIESLPACTLRQVPLAQIPRDAARWIDGG